MEEKYDYYDGPPSASLKEKDIIELGWEHAGQ